MRHYEFVDPETAELLCLIDVYLSILKDDDDDQYLIAKLEEIREILHKRAIAKMLLSLLEDNKIQRKGGQAGEEMMSLGDA